MYITSKLLKYIEIRTILYNSNTICKSYPFNSLFIIIISGNEGSWQSEKICIYKYIFQFKLFV